MAAKGRHNPFGDSSKNFVFFPSLSHKKGVHRIVRGLESNCGLILLTGEIGIGKTSLARYIQSFLADRFVFVELGNPYQTPLEQMFYCCEQLGLDTTGFSSIHDCVGKLEAHSRSLMEEGRRPVIVFDESHLLTTRHLSLIHILSNLRAEDGPLVQILIVGQLEILDLLATPGMEALNQRIGVRCELSPLDLGDTDKYINFKLERGGRSGLISFSSNAVEKVWQDSGGLPRLINHVCAHVLDGLAFKDTNVVSSAMVEEVCRDSVYSGLFQARSRPPVAKKKYWLAGLAGGCVLGALIVGAFFAKDFLAPEVVSQNDSRKDIVIEPVTDIHASPTGLSAFEKKEEAGEIGVPLQTEAVAVEQTAPTPVPDEESVDNAAIATSIEEAVAPQLDLEKSEVVIVIDNEGAGASEVAGSGETEVSGSGETEEPEGTQPLSSALDGDAHPVVGKLVIGAIAWNADPTARIAVINSTLLHEGETVDGTRVLDIGQDYILLEYDGLVYRRTITR